MPQLPVRTASERVEAVWRPGRHGWLGGEHTIQRLPADGGEHRTRGPGGGSKPSEVQRTQRCLHHPIVHFAVGKRHGEKDAAVLVHLGEPGPRPDAPTDEVVCATGVSAEAPGRSGIHRAGLRRRRVLPLPSRGAVLRVDGILDTPRAAAGLIRVIVIERDITVRLKASVVLSVEASLRIALHTQHRLGVRAGAAVAAAAHLPKDRTILVECSVGDASDEVRSAGVAHRDEHIAGACIDINRVAMKGVQRLLAVHRHAGAMDDLAQGDVVARLPRPHECAPAGHLLHDTVDDCRVRRACVVEGCGELGDLAADDHVVPVGHREKLVRIRRLERREDGRGRLRVQLIQLVADRCIHTDAGPVQRHPGDGVIGKRLDVHRTAGHFPIPDWRTAAVQNHGVGARRAGGRRIEVPGEVVAAPRSSDMQHRKVMGQASDPVLPSSRCHDQRRRPLADDHLD